MRNEISPSEWLNALREATQQFISKHPNLSVFKATTDTSKEEGINNVEDSIPTESLGLEFKGSQVRPAKIVAPAEVLRAERNAPSHAEGERRRELLLPSCGLSLLGASHSKRPSAPARPHQKCSGFLILLLSFQTRAHSVPEAIPALCCGVFGAATPVAPE